MSDAIIFGLPKSEWQQILGTARDQSLRDFSTYNQEVFKKVSEFLFSSETAAALNLPQPEAPAAHSAPTPAPAQGPAAEGGGGGGGRKKAGAAAGDPNKIREKAAAASSKKIIDIRKDESKDKLALQKKTLNLGGVLQDGLKAGMQQAGMEIGNSFSTLVVQLKQGSVDAGQVFSDLAKAMARAIINAIGEGLIQKGAGRLAEGIGDMIAGQYKDGAGEMVSAALMAAAGGAIKGVAAAFLAEGGVVTRPTLSVVGEGGQSEAVIPLDRLKGMKVSGGALRIGRFEADMSGGMPAAVASAPSTGVSQERRFLEIQQKANRRSGRRNA